MSMFSDFHNESLAELYDKTLDELENVRKSDDYKNGSEYLKGLIDGAIIQIIKLTKEINW